MKNDKYQLRYEAHQAKKAEILRKLIKERHSTRLFDKREIEPEKLEELVTSIDKCPSSCDRGAIYSVLTSDRDEKAILGGMLVGGVGWVHRAPSIILLFADPVAYKAGDEIKFMPFLDAGVAVESLYLVATSLGLKGCFINPNIREMNKKHFENIFGDAVFCGAFAVGYEESK